MIRPWYHATLRQWYVLIGLLLILLALVSPAQANVAPTQAPELSGEGFWGGLTLLFGTLAIIASTRFKK
jgi:uncharacterized membrane protein